METSASFEAWSAPSPYPAMIGEVVETSASFEARFRATILSDQLKGNARSNEGREDWR